MKKLLLFKLYFLTLLVGAQPKPNKFIKAFSHPVWKIGGYDETGEFYPLHVSGTVAVEESQKKLLSDTYQHLRAFNIKTGKTLWKISWENDNWFYNSSAIVWNNKIYYTAHGILYCRDIKTGAALWMCQTNSYLCTKQTYIADSLLYTFPYDKYSSSYEGKKMFVLSASTGKILWDSINPMNIPSFDGILYSYNNKIIVKPDSFYICYNATTKKEIWRLTASNKNFNYYNIDWQCTRRDTIYFRKHFNIYQNGFYFINIDTLISIDMNSGKILLKFQSIGSVRADKEHAVFSLDEFYNFTDSTRIFSLNKIDYISGKTIWKTEIAKAPLTPKNLAHMHFYPNICYNADSSTIYLSVDSTLFCYSQGSGKLLSSFNLHMFVIELFLTKDFIVLNSEFPYPADIAEGNMLVLAKNDFKKSARLHSKNYFILDRAYQYPDILCFHEEPFGGLRLINIK